jgi:hypothetical protein
MIMQREFVEISGELFEVLRTVREEHQPVVDVWKDHLRADRVFRKDGYYFFCRLIEEAVIEEVIEDRTIETIVDDAVIEPPTENIDI